MPRAKTDSPILGSFKRLSQPIEYDIIMTLGEEDTDKTLDTQGRQAMKKTQNGKDRSKPKRKTTGRKTGKHSSTKTRNSGTARVKYNKKTQKRPKTSKKSEQGKICPHCSQIMPSPDT